MPADPTAATARAELVAALVEAGEGDRAAFARVYRLTSAKLFGICLRICEDRQAAEDVLQEVYAIVWKRAGAFEPGQASPISWLAAIARNRAIDWRRSRRGRMWAPAETMDGLPDERGDAERELLEDEAGRRLSACLAELGNPQAGVIRQAFFGGLTYAELAERRGVPLGTVKSWIRRGLIRLRGCLDGGT